MNIYIYIYLFDQLMHLLST